MLPSSTRCFLKYALLSPVFFQLNMCGAPYTSSCTSHRRTTICKARGIPQRKAALHWSQNDGVPTLLRILLLTLQRRIRGLETGIRTRERRSNLLRRDGHLQSLRVRSLTGHS